MTAGRDPGSESRDSLTELDPRLRERVLTLDEPVAWEDWEDVVTRSRAVRNSGFRRPRPTYVAVAIIAAVAMAAVIDFSLPSPAGDDSAVRKPRELTTFDLGTPPTTPANAIAWQSRIITSVRLRDGLHTLYVAPTTQGGFCYQWTGDETGGCATLGKGPLAASWGTHRVVGVVSSATASWVTIVFTDGTSAKPPIAWISDPIDAGFFLYDIPTGKTVARVTSNGEGGALNQVTWYSV